MVDSNDILLSALLNGAGLNNQTPDISAFQKTVAANDLYQMAATPVLAAKFDTSTWSPGTTFGVTAGQAFLGSVLNELGNRRQGEQLAKVAEVLPSLYRNPAAVAVPEGVDSEAFGILKLGAMSNKFRTDESIRDALGQKGVQVNPDGSIQPMKGMDAIESLFGGRGNNAAGANQVQKEIIEEKGKLQTTKQSLDFIDTAFDRAKNLTGYATGIASEIGIPTDKGNALQGLQDSIIVQIDNALGREINSDVRKRLLNLAPKFYDNEKTLNEKKEAMKLLVGSLSKPTPVLDSITGQNNNKVLLENKINTGSLTKVINGVPYVKVEGGWKKAQ